jgi:hypothetical protein
MGLPYGKVLRKPSPFPPDFFPRWGSLPCPGASAGRKCGGQGGIFPTGPNETASPHTLRTALLTLRIPGMVEALSVLERPISGAGWGMPEALFEAC